MNTKYASRKKAKNLVEIVPLKDGLAGATRLADARNEFAEQLGREGYSKCTIKACVHYLDRMERKGINISARAGFSEMWKSIYQLTMSNLK